MEIAETRLKLSVHVLEGQEVTGDTCKGDTDCVRYGLGAQECVK